MTGELALVASVFAVCGASLTGFLLWLRFQRERFPDDERIAEIKRTFALHEVRTKKVCEELAAAMNASIVELRAKVSTQELREIGAPAKQGIFR